MAAAPSTTVHRVEGIESGKDIVRVYSRIGSGTYKPGTQGPLIRREGMTKSTGVYEKHTTTGEGETITILPGP